ncbi:hypothetical protein RvY_04865 [Ramazzottius varieornatus]|uniref:Cation-transporting P-type ATPase N-terminal domain-containing protein n=1 Tax=Ramazzottius varieornatus TaxID=947166 RepID=A0A1D1V283_RAMVA|nr:hypothetical protein RvY_04865 [Ramazzottius varieornatus]
MENQQANFDRVLQVVRNELNITGEKDLEDVKGYLRLKQLGVTAGTVTAVALQKTLFGEAPTK